MNFSDIANLVENKLIPKFVIHEGIKSYFEQKSRFEGWLQVEITGLLKTFFSDNVIPEKHKNIDIVVGNWGIELKVFASDTKYKVPDKICKFMNSIKNKDQINKSKLINNVIIFIVFPKIINNITFNNHLEIIEKHCSKFKKIEININESLNGMLYIGELIKN